MAMVMAGGRMVRRHVTHVRHTLADTGLDVDGREPADDDIGHSAQNEELKDPLAMSGAVPQDAAEIEDVPVQSEERELTGEECIQQYPGLWEEFNKIVDAERGEQDVQGPGVPEEDVQVEQEGDDDGDHRVTRSMTKKRALVTMLAMASIAKVLRAKKKKSQEIGGSEVDTEGFEEARQK